MGKGPLERLLGAKSNQERVIYVNINEITTNPFQPRKEFDRENLSELAQSILSYGVIQPIIVRKAREGYQIVAGERRYRACQLIGLKEIPAIVQDMNDEKAAAVSLIENLQRKDLNYFEEANAYSILISTFGMTQEELARKVGKSQSAIANKLRLLKLSSMVRSYISPDIITERHARALLKLNSPEMQYEVVKQIYQKELTVKETEELVEKLRVNNIPQETAKEAGPSVSMIIRDARIFLNTIKETVSRAKQTGIEIYMVENDNDREYEVTIRIPKQKIARQRTLA
ncbi:MAG: nucleoid occlusion protein [Syntrophomonadaceae bacterium]|jgi:ParB family chromosome partitioning protein